MTLAKAPYYLKFLWMNEYLFFALIKLTEKKAEDLR